MVTIAIDAMGGDVGLAVTLPAAISFLNDYPDAGVIVVGDESAICAHLKGQIPERFEIVHSTQVVAMDEAPQLALKNKKDSSMRVAINLVKEGRAAAAVSAGNTGALMATARFVLKTLPGVSRPAIAKFLPAAEGKLVCALDLGANIDCPSEQLVQFAVMGAHLVSFLYPEKTNPSVGLLNVGTEEIKGTAVIKETYGQLKNSPLNFIGNVEGNDLFTGEVDVVVCDGFVGNVALKTIEGSVHFIGDVLKSEFKRAWYTKWVALWAIPVFRSFKKRLDPRRFNGAIFLGLRGIVIKSHGGTDEVGFAFALEEAYRHIKSNIAASLEESVPRVLAQIAPTAEEE